MNGIKVLGAYGAKDMGKGTSSFLIDDNNLIDAGNIINSMGSKSIHIDNIWLTHSHFDHISDIPFIIDTYFSLRKKSLKIYGLKETIKTIKENLLNDKIWPDFSKIQLPNSKEMAVKYIIISKNKSYTINNNLKIKAIGTYHIVPSCGYSIEKNNHHILISSDTYKCKNILKEISNNKNIKYLVIKCSFPSKLEKLAKITTHLTPKLLEEFLKDIRQDIKIYINHIKPIFEKEIKEEIKNSKLLKNVNILSDMDLIPFK